MYVFHHNLKTVETTCFRNLHLFHKIGGQVLIYDAIACSEESQYMGDEMLFILSK